MLFLFIVSRIKSKLQSELDDYFQQLHGTNFSRRFVSDVAFCKARKKLSHTAFIEVHRKVVDHFYRVSNYKKWFGFRLVSIDGSKITLPKSEELREAFSASADSTIKAQISAAYDPLNKIGIDHQITSITGSEKEMFVQHLEVLNQDDLVILDRGYPSFFTFKCLYTKNINFCIRIHSSFYSICNDFFKSNETDRIVTIYAASKESKRDCLLHDLDIDGIAIRLVKVILDSGEIEVLATSLLDKKKYPHTLFKKLYFLRWPVEEYYKTIKHTVQLESFSGKSKLAVLQDYYACGLIMALAAVFAFPVNQKLKQKRKRQKLDYRINWKMAFAKLKRCITKLFSVQHCKETLVFLYQELSKNTCPVRDGRSYQRNVSASKKKFHQQYKPV